MNDIAQLRTPDASSSHYDNWLRYQAHSILIGLVDNPDIPTTEQARDILSWAAKARARKPSRLQRFWRAFRRSNP